MFANFQKLLNEDNNGMRKRKSLQRPIRHKISWEHLNNLAS